VAEFDIAAANERLQQRRDQFAMCVADGSFESLSKEEKEAVAPEVREIVWLDLVEAVSHAYTSMHKEFTPVNEFQRAALEEHGVHKRDPLFITMLSLLELETFPSTAALLAHSKAISMEEARAKAEYYQSGVTLEEVKQIYASLSDNRVPTASDLKRLKEERSRACL